MRVTISLLRLCGRAKPVRTPGGGFAPAGRSPLARLIDQRAVHAGETVIREGEPGDTFYLIGDGEFLATSVAGDVHRTMTAGDHFGEIGLLRSVPRTALVTAVTDGTVWALARDEFLDVVSSNGMVQAAADAVTLDRLRGTAEREPTPP